MSSRFLPVFQSNALYEAGRRVPAVVQHRASQGFVLELCQDLRTAGIADLFLTGTSRELHRCLQMSGQAFAYFLTSGHPTLITSQSLPFFDAVAAGDLDLANRIATSARRTFSAGEEYEEDFLFVDFLMSHYFLGRPAAASMALLDRYEKVLEGSDDSRLIFCQALLSNDALAFVRGLGEFLAERCRRYDALADKSAIPPERLHTEGRLSVEGIALVRLARRAGMEVPNDLPQVPSVALEGAAPPAAPDAWTTVRVNAP